DASKELRSSLGFVRTVWPQSSGNELSDDFYNSPLPVALAGPIVALIWAKILSASSLDSPELPPVNARFHEEAR
ncbi:MAG: hypothetical protein WCD69_16265, partial [Xanthobacteraceae bacterium]